MARFIAGTVAHPAYKEMRENLDTVEGRSRISAMVADELGRRAIADPEYMERAKARFMGDWDRKHQNIEAVALKALEKAEGLPESKLDAEDTNRQPEEDWLNSFTRAAEDASSDDLRERLASILAGEARRPGTYARSTVRLVAELDRDILTRFQKVLSLRVGDHIPKGADWDANYFSDGLLLEDAGLISGSHGLLQKSMNFPEEGRQLYPSDSFALVLYGKPGTKKAVSACLLTRAGREIATLLPWPHEIAALRRLAMEMDKTSLTQIQLAEIVSQNAGQTIVREREALWNEEVAR